MDLWPDADERAIRRAALHSKLDAFLDDWVESQGGYAPTTDEQSEQLREIVNEIVDLKWQRDPDGDQVIVLHMENRKRGRLITGFIPHEPSASDTLSALDWQQSMIRTIGGVQNELSAASMTLHRVIEEHHRREQKNVQIEVLWHALTAAVSNQDASAVETIIAQVCGSNPPSKTDRPLLAATHPRRDEFLALAATIHTAAVESAATEITTVLDEFDAADCFNREIEHRAFQTLDGYSKKYSRKVFRAHYTRFNEISNVKRKARNMVKSSE